MKNYIESTSTISMTKAKVPIQSNKVINHKGWLKCSSNSFKSFIIVFSIANIIHYYNNQGLFNKFF